MLSLVHLVSRDRAGALYRGRNSRAQLCPRPALLLPTLTLSVLLFPLSSLSRMHAPSFMNVSLSIFSLIRCPGYFHTSRSSRNPLTRGPSGGLPVDADGRLPHIIESELLPRNVRRVYVNSRRNDPRGVTDLVSRISVRLSRVPPVPRTHV